MQPDTDREMPTKTVQGGIIFFRENCPLTGLNPNFYLLLYVIVNIILKIEQIIRDKIIKYQT